MKSTAATAYFPVEIEGRQLLIDATLVREVLGSTAWLPVPHPTQLLPGVMAYNGRAVAVLDLAASLGLAAVERGENRPRVLVAWLDDEFVALLIDGAREVVRISSHAVRAPHAVPLPFAIGEVQQGEEVMTVVDLRALVQQAALHAGGGG